jgi:hypothetical protein
VAHSPRKPKPTFDVARDPIPETTSGWVYRTEVEQPQPDLRPILVVHPIAQAAPEESASVAYTMFSAGVYLMTLPVRLGVSIMMTPLHWMLGSRR